MVDSLSKKKRSQNMAAIKGKGSKPEITVRKFLHGQGFRYSLHRKDLAEKPDIVLPKFNTVIFVNGCYWHRHKGCKLAYTPKSNIEFWKTKFSQNIERDQKNYSSLMQDGWKIIIIWECEVKDRSFKNWIVDRIKN